MNDAGIPVEFAETTPPAVLVDFDGGKRTFKATPTGGAALPDDAASNLLILTADGKLIVRNTRADSGTGNDAKVRLERISDWKAKVDELRATPEGGPRPGPAPGPRPGPGSFDPRRPGGG